MTGFFQITGVSGHLRES